MFYRFCRFWLKVFIPILYRVNIKGIENFPKEGPVLIYCNHLGILDFFLISYKLKRQVHFMAKAESFKNPLMKIILDGLGAFPVNRGKGDIASIKKTLSLLKQGKVVCIFPEGTRVRKKPHVKAKAGAAMFAYRSNALIQPVAIRGKFNLFSKIDLFFGEPYRINFDKSKEHNKEDFTKITQDIMDRIYSMIDYRIE